MPNTIIVTREEPIAIVQLNRPVVLNALNDRHVEELSHYFGALHKDRDCRVVVLKGAGRAYCAGLDLQEGGRSEFDTIDRLAHERRIAHARQHHHACSRKLCNEGDQARQAMRVGQVQIEQHQINGGLLVAVQGQRLLQGARLEHLDLVPAGSSVRLHQRAQAQAHQVMVIHHQHAGGLGSVRGVRRRGFHDASILKRTQHTGK